MASASDSTPPYFGYLAAMAVWKDSIAIADTRGSSIHVLPRSLEGGRSFGREGEGPGELRRPQGVATVGDTLFIFDRANARVTWFDGDGQLIGQRDFMIPSLKPGFVPVGPAEIWIPAADSVFYVSVIQSQRASSRIPRSEGFTPTEPGITSNMIVSLQRQPVVVDAENARVIFSGFKQGATYDLPRELAALVDARVKELRAPGRVVTPIIAAGPTRDGVALWFPFQEGTVGAVVNESGDWRALVLDPSVDFHGYPVDILVWDNELFVLTPDGIRVYDLGLS